MVKWPFWRKRDNTSINLDAPETTPEEVQEQLSVEQEPNTELPEQQELSELPPEVQEYYESENQQRRGVAWMLGFATLMVTLLLALGLFFGGRWAYRKVTNSDNKKPTTTAQTNQNSGNTGSAETKLNQGTSSTSTNTPSVNNSTDPTPTPPAQNNSSSTTHSQPQTGKTTPNTGPGDVVAIFVLSSLAGAALYQVIVRRQVLRSR